MNVFTGWTGWLIFAVLILTGWLLLGVAAAAVWHLTRRAYLAVLGVRPGAPPDHVIRDRFHAEAERLYPDGDDNQPWPCSHEDGWCVCVPEPSDPRWSA